MMKQFIISYSAKIALLLWIYLVTAACSYLDVSPPEKATIQDAFESESKGLGFLLSCYSKIPSFYGDEGNSWIADLMFAASDEHAPYYGWNTRTLTMVQGRVTPSYGFMEEWHACYEMLGQCYLFEEELEKASPVWLKPDVKKRWLAEISFLKGYYHFILLQAWGPIPLMESRYDQNVSSVGMAGRSHFDYCVDRIVNWFDDAARDLPAIVVDTEWRRATSVVCKALKSRLLVYAASPLWNGSFPYSNWTNDNYETPGYGKELVSKTNDSQKWERARIACTEALDHAINEGGHELFGYNRSSQSQDFTDVLRFIDTERLNLNTLNVDDSQDENFKLTVLLMRYLMTTNAQEGNKEVIWQMGGQGANEKLGVILPGNALFTSQGTWVGGSSALSVSLYSAERFYTKDGKIPENDPQYTSKSNWLESAGLSNDNIIRLNHNREPRFYAWFSFDGDQYSPMMADGQPLIIEARNSSRQGYRLNTSINQTGYFIKKWVQPDFTYRNPDGAANAKSLSYINIRLAELYLNLAECYAAQGNMDKAIEYLNPIRIRAGIPKLTPQMVNESGMDIMQWARNERFIELWGEMHRYFDLRRWAIAPTRLNATSMQGLNAMKINPSFNEFNQVTTLSNLQIKWMTRMYLCPIPQHNVYSNTNLVQAPGY